MDSDRAPEMAMRRERRRAGDEDRGGRMKWMMGKEKMKERKMRRVRDHWIRAIGEV